MLHLYIDSDSLILDFFSGSATTAHAVMQLNTEDGGNRKFICVQLPEPCDEKSEAFKAGYKNICEIGKERIRRAGEKILNECGVLRVELKIQITQHSKLQTAHSIQLVWVCLSSALQITSGRMLQSSFQIIKRKMK